MASRPTAQGRGLTMPDTPLRGRRGRDRRIAERVATDFASRHAPVAAEDEVDFDVAAVDAEVEDAREAATDRQRASAKATRPAASRERVARGVPGSGTDRTRKPGGHRLPN